ncbi:DsrE family protein [Roseibium sp.]|uniref:DsrE family protein n=1 Tax=Roseibium sp. TaxID=1936156 RepID=UPI00329A62C6
MVRNILLAVACSGLLVSNAVAQDRAPAIANFGAIAPIDGHAVQPDPELRYRVVFSITEASPAGGVNRSLEKVARYLNLLAAGNVRAEAGDIVAVIHGPATPILSNAADNPNLELIAALNDAGVTIAVCSQAMHRAQLSADNLAPGVRIDASALTTLTTLQLRGWAVVYD